MNFYIGIDPGYNGACVILNDTGDIAYCDDLPIITWHENHKQVKTLDVSSFLLTTKRKNAYAVIELPLIFSKQSQRAQLNSGMLYGQLLTCLMLNDIHIRAFYPMQWKGVIFGRRHTTKGDSIKKAISIQPAMEPYLQRKKDHDRAEAFLLAHYSRRLFSQ